MKLIRLSNELELADAVSTHKQIVIYGVGQIAQELWEYLSFVGESHRVAHFIVTNLENSKLKMRGLPVLEVKMLVERPDCLCLVAVDELYHSEIIELLMKNKVNNTVALVRKNLRKELTDIVGAHLSDKDKENVLIKLSNFAAKWRTTADTDQKNEMLREIYIKCGYKKYVKDLKIPECSKYDILFVSLPGGNISSPFLTVPCLAGKLQARGISSYQIELLYSSVPLKASQHMCLNQLENISKKLENTNISPILDTIFKLQLLPILIDCPKKIIGIDVMGEGKFIPACLTAQLLKAISHHTQIVMVGSCADKFAISHYQPKSDIYNYFDYVVLGEGETAFYELYRYVMEDPLSLSLDQIPNLTSRIGRRLR